MPDRMDAIAREHLSEEDRILIGMSDEEIRDMVSVWSFKSFETRDRLEKGDDWQKVIQIHLYVDHIITQILSDSLADPDAINLSRMSFQQKHELCQAMGIMPDNLRQFVTHINKLRNKVAHKLDFELSPVFSHQLRSQMSADARTLYDEIEKSEVPNLAVMGLVVVVMLEVYRHQLAFKKMKRRQREVGLFVAIKNAKEVLAEIER